MPLPQSGPREELHLRKIDMRGYRRSDGLFEIEGHLADTKTFTFIPRGSPRTIPPGEPVHDMWIRLVVDEDLRIHEALAATDLSPYRQCPEAASALARLAGLTIGSGWQAAIRKRLGRADSCTHLRELLIPLASAAYQTLAGVKNKKDLMDASGRPVKLDSCYAYGSSREQVMLRWPAFYTGKSASPVAQAEEAIRPQIEKASASS